MPPLLRPIRCPRNPVPFLRLAFRPPIASENGSTPTPGRPATAPRRLHPGFCTPCPHTNTGSTPHVKVIQCWALKHRFVYCLLENVELEWHKCASFLGHFGI